MRQVSRAYNLMTKGPDPSRLCMGAGQLRLAHLVARVPSSSSASLAMR